MEGIIKITTYPMNVDNIQLNLDIHFDISWGLFEIEIPKEYLDRFRNILSSDEDYWDLIDKDGEISQGDWWDLKWGLDCLQNKLNNPLPNQKIM